MLSSSTEPKDTSSEGRDTADRSTDGNLVDSLRRLEVEGGSDENRAVIQAFHDTVRTYFRGPLKPPFNEHARRAAGFGPEWYEPLAVKGD